MTLTLENIHRGITHLMSLDIKWGIPHLLGVSGFAQRGAFAQESFCAYNLMLHERIVDRPPTFLHKLNPSSIWGNWVKMLESGSSIPGSEICPGVEQTWVGNLILGWAPPKLGLSGQNPLFCQTRDGTEDDKNNKYQVPKYKRSNEVTHVEKAKNKTPIRRNTGTTKPQNFTCKNSNP